MVDFRVLGPVEVVRDGQSLLIGGPRPRTLLALLVVEAGGAVSSARLARELWGDDPPATATSSLHVHLSTLRRALGARLRTTSAGYVLEASPDEVDALRFERALAAARGRAEDPGTAAVMLREALETWRGPAFDGIEPGPTTAAAAARLEELKLAAVEDRVEADLALGRHAELVPELRGLLRAHPMRERLAGQLMLALHRSDRSADALRVYDEVAEALDRTLGVDPGDDLAALARAIRRGDPTLGRPGPAGLPLPTTSFVGRTAELAELRELLGATRLLTLVGPGGGGKSRLALELARAVALEHPGGMFLVGLGGLAVTDSVTRAVASVLDARERPGEPLVAAISRRLSHGRALVLLDDCERLAPECASLCTTLLERSPGVRLLATSREPLGAAGEAIYRVGGLAVPRLRAPRVEQLEADAVRLLVERAAARPGLEPDPADLDAAVTICRHLDGLPLAIELVAARLRSLSMGEAAERVVRHLDLLGGGRSSGHERHRTMRAAIDWSHNLLEEPERVLLRRLSVFAGGFGASAVEAVAGAGAPVEQPVAVLGQLVDRSLVEAALRPGQPARYRLLEVVRQYATERLGQAGEERAARAAHADWFARLGAGARRWGGGQQAAWLHRIETDLDNVRAALGWYLGDGWEPERALRLIADVWWVWNVRGMVGESRAWLRRALAATSAAPSETRAAALLAAAAAARGTGAVAEAADLGRQGLEVQRALGDQWGEAAALNGLCITAAALGDLDAALEYAEASLSTIERVGTPGGIAVSRLSLGGVLRARGDLERPGRLFEAARLAFAELGDQRGGAAALSAQAMLAFRRREPDEALRSALDSLAIYGRLGYDEGEADCLEIIACLRTEAGHAAAALRLLVVADGVRERLGAPMLLPDERAARAAAEVAIAGALDDMERRRVADEATGLDLDAVVRELLAGRTFEP